MTFSFYVNELWAVFFQGYLNKMQIVDLGVLIAFFYLSDFFHFGETYI